jgi:hypothetical protein
VARSARGCRIVEAGTKVWVQPSRPTDCDAAHFGFDLIRTMVRGLQPTRDATGKRFFLSELRLPVTKPEQSTKLVT